MLQLSSIVEMPNKAEEFLDLYSKNIDMPVILYGGGRACEWFIKFMYRYEIPIACIIDKNRTICDKNGILILTPEEAYEKYQKAIVVISAMAYKNEIEKSILHNRPDFFIASFDPTLEVLQKRDYAERKKYFSGHEEEFYDLENVLEDELSKIVLKNVIMGAITSNSECYKESASDSQYFPDIIKETLTQEEIFVDVGAFTGDSVQEFILAVHNKYKKIYAFEPDSDNVSIAKENIKDKRIVFWKKGVGKENTIVNFMNENEGIDEGAHVVEEKSGSTTEVEIVKLDDVIKEKITYIKMDIEGMELDALKGAEKLIHRFRPKMAISVYHKMEDILEISNHIRNYKLGYKLYLRHYWNCNGTDTILFAI